MKSFLKAVLPESWRRLLRPSRRWQWFRGDYRSWAEARAASAGYDDAAVLQRVVAATRDVRAGRAAWERDGSTFAEPAVNEPLLAALQAVRAACGGKLDLVDFGGGLGGTWRQHRDALGGDTGVKWTVVEQPHYVTAGREFADGVVQFQPSLDAGPSSGPGRAVLLSSVLQYLEHPHELLGELDRRGFDHVIIDRTALAVDGRDRIVVQHTPPSLGGGSYPAWFFNRDRLLAALGPRFALQAEWPGFDDVDPRVAYRGFRFRRQEVPS